MSGRQSICTEELVQEICNRLEAGETILSIGRLEHMPAARTLYDWLENKIESVPKDISARIARARDIGFDTVAEKTMETARGRGDSSNDIQRDKLIIDTDLKLLSKWSKRYGDKQLGDAENPVNMVGVLKWKDE